MILKENPRKKSDGSVGGICVSREQHSHRDDEGGEGTGHVGYHALPGLVSYLLSFELVNQFLRKATRLRTISN